MTCEKIRVREGNFTLVIHLSRHWAGGSEGQREEEHLLSCRVD